METSEWLAQANRDKVLLRCLISEYHPSRRGVRSPEEVLITAPAAERACEEVRQRIKDQNDSDPLERFDTALEAGDWRTVYSLLDQAWFGVPKTTSCWRIDGFTQAVDLMDDPPDPLRGGFFVEP